jgi:hypothetical protein
MLNKARVVDVEYGDWTWAEHAWEGHIVNCFPRRITARLDQQLNATLPVHVQTRHTELRVMTE